MANISLTSFCTIMVLIVAILSPILVSRAETNLAYHVSIGDKRTYRVIERYHVNDEGKKEELETLETLNSSGKKVNFTLKKGTTFTYTITDINNSGVYGIKITDNEYKSPKRKFTYSSNDIIMKTIENISYFQELGYDLEGDFFVKKTGMETCDVPPTIYRELFKWSIKTGWLESYSQQTFVGSTLRYEYTIQRISPSPPLFLYLLLSIAALGTGMLLAYFYERIKLLK